MKRLTVELLLHFFICIQGFSQQPILVNDGVGDLYSVDLTNCTSRIVCKTSQAFYDIAFTLDGRLWGIDGGLYSIDTTNGSTTLIGESTGTESVSLVGLNDSVLLSEANDSLYGINVRNAQSYNIGNIGYSSCGDLGWLGNDLYLAAATAQIIKIALNGTYSAILSSTPLNSAGNPINCFVGLATASFNGVDSLIGFMYNGNADRISPIDGTYQLICSSLPNQSDLQGTASMSFPTTLPIHLLNFSYTIVSKTVQLQWQTVTELNSDYFSIQRSTDGINFITIGKQAAAGNSSSLKEYLFIDTHPLNVNYYRLQEVDINGNITYSNVQSVKLPQTQALIIIEDPVQSTLELQINSGQSQINHLTIFDLMGRRSKTFNVQNGFQNIDVSFLEPGTYILQMIAANGQVYDKSFVKNR